MSYQKALEAAGITVHDYQEFGSYQGDWVAHVSYEGETGFIRGWYGSCSWCDSFESEFGYLDEKKGDYQTRLADFGQGYLPVQSAEEVKKSFSPDWDYGAKEAIDWINARSNQE